MCRAAARWSDTLVAMGQTHAADGLDLVAAAHEAAERFGLGTVLGTPRPVDEAWSNDVLSIHASSGHYAVKLFTRDLGSALRTGMAVEAAALLTGQIPMPKPVPAVGYDNSARHPDAWLAELELPSGRHRARCHRWVDGVPASRVGPTREVARDVGTSLGILHSQRLPGGDTADLEVVDLDRWRRTVSAGAKAGMSWAPDLAALTPLVEERAACIVELRTFHRPMRMSHRDVDPKNAVRRTDGAVALTDWDYAGPLLAEVELVVAAVSFAGGLLDADEELVREFVAAYRAAGGDAGAADALAMCVETVGDVEWLLRNVEACITPGRDIADRQRLATELIGTFHRRWNTLRRWAGLVANL